MEFFFLLLSLKIPNFYVIKVFSGVHPLDSITSSEEGWNSVTPINRNQVIFVITPANKLLNWLSLEVELIK